MTPSNIYLRADIQAHWHAAEALERAAQLQGEIYRQVAGRRTLRVQVGERAYFLKFHEGVGWREILKNLLILRVPIVGARNEFLACRLLEEKSISAPRVAAYAQHGLNPATRRSFVLCDALDDHVSLEDFTLTWPDSPPPTALLRSLTDAVADFARSLHTAGIVHRDFYICHLLLDEKALKADRYDLAVIDLHRALRYHQIPRRWSKRDLAALLFSVLDLPVHRYAWLRFVRRYRARPLREIFASEGDYWREIYNRAVGLYRKSERKGLTQGRFKPDV